MRKSKTVGTTTTEFIWAGGLLMAQIGSDGTTIAWHYDQSGKMMGFSLNNIPYFYLRNLQGDIIAILDAAGNVVAEYAYDAWGEILTAEGPLAGVNPIRYRGYYWDRETGFYYCMSRYYNPEWARWISADVFMDTGDGIMGTNMYAYCLNDPVNLCDPSGYAPGPLPDLNSPAFMISDFTKINKPLINQVNYKAPNQTNKGFVEGLIKTSPWEKEPNQLISWYQTLSPASSEIFGTGVQETFAGAARVGTKSFVTKIATSQIARQTFSVLGDFTSTAVGGTIAEGGVTLSAKGARVVPVIGSIVGTAVDIGLDYATYPDDPANFRNAALVSLGFGVVNLGVDLFFPGASVPVKLLAFGLTTGGEIYIKNLVKR